MSRNHPLDGNMIAADAHYEAEGQYREEACEADDAADNEAERADAINAERRLEA